MNNIENENINAENINAFRRMETPFLMVDSVRGPEMQGPKFENGITANFIHSTENGVGFDTIIVETLMAHMPESPIYFDSPLIIDGNITVKGDVKVEGIVGENDKKIKCMACLKTASGIQWENNTLCFNCIRDVVVYHRAKQSYIDNHGDPIHKLRQEVAELMKEIAKLKKEKNNERSETKF